MEEGNLSENNLTSAAAFVDGGIQEAYDDTCSICLEAFCDSDPSSVTCCKHEFHLQCILEWCQRSSQCPMCWQPISLKDPSSQELLEAVEHERNMRMNPPRNMAIFHHPTLGDFELQHLPITASESELEERIIQHLAAAAAVGRARQLVRREGQRSRSSTQGRPQFLVLPTHPNGASGTSAHREGSGLPPAVMIAGPNSPFITIAEDSSQLMALPSSQDSQLMTITSGPSPVGNGTSSSNRRSPAQNTPSTQDRAGPSDFQSFSETLKSRLNALSMRYKDSITKSTRGWKERLFARNSYTPEQSAEVCRDVSQSITTVPRLMDHLQIGEDGRANIATLSTNVEDNSTLDPIERPAISQDDMQAPCASSSSSK